MEAAGDFEAQQIAKKVSDEIGIRPSAPMESWILNELSGRLLQSDIDQLRSIEKVQPIDGFGSTQLTYLKCVRLFNQYVLMRYRAFLDEHDGPGCTALHSIVVDAMLSGKMRALTEWLDSQLNRKRAFMALFKIWAKDR
jgi:hypothetical protein